MEFKSTVKNNKSAILALVCFIGLVITGALGQYWYHIGSSMSAGGTNSMTDPLVFSISYMMVPVAFGALTLVCIQYLRPEKVFKGTSVIFYPVILCVTAAALILNHHADFKMYLNIFGIYNLYVPALCALSIIPAAYFLCRSNPDVPKFCTLILTLALPVCIMMLLFRSGYDVTMEMGIMMYALMIKLLIDKKIQRSELICLIVLMLCSFALVCICYKETHGGESLLVHLFSGLGNTSGSGQLFSEMTEALKQSKWIGQGDYVFSTGAQILPGYLAFAAADLIYLPLCLILRFGRIAGILPIGFCIGLAGHFFILSSKCRDNPFSRYLTFSVGIYLAAKMVVAYLACFVAPLRGGVLSFCSTTSVFIDTILCASAVAAYRHRDKFEIKQRETGFLSDFSHKMLAWFGMEEDTAKDDQYKVCQIVIDSEDDLDESFRIVRETFDKLKISMDDIDIRVTVNESHKNSDQNKSESHLITDMKAALQSIIETSATMLKKLEEDKKKTKNSE